MNYLLVNSLTCELVNYIYESFKGIIESVIEYSAGAIELHHVVVALGVQVGEGEAWHLLRPIRLLGLGIGDDDFAPHGDAATPEGYDTNEG